MRIKAVKMFISSRFGNVRAGQVIETNDAMGKHLIECGLAQEVKIIKQEDAVDPTAPIAETTPGASLQAAQALPKKTATKFVRGASKAKKGKSLS